MLLLFSIKFPKFRWGSILQSSPVPPSLIKYGAQIDATNESTNEWGCTPLHLAAVEGEINVAKCLIEHGARIHIRDKDYKTPFDLAKIHGYHELATYLLEIKKEALNQKPSTIIDDKAPCIICFEPRNGFYVLYPCGHAALCEPCTYKLVIQNDSKCLNCREIIQITQKCFSKNQNPSKLKKKPFESIFMTNSFIIYINIATISYIHRMNTYYLKLLIF